MLGSDLAAALRQRDLVVPLCCPTHGECDLSEDRTLFDYLSKIKPSLILNAAGFANVDNAESARSEAFAANVSGPAWLARYSEDNGAKLIHFSTDQVYDGKKGTSYSEEDAPNPLNYYAETKWLGEQAVLKNSNSLILRVQWLYGRTRDRFSPLKNRNEFSAFSDQFGAPTWTVELCRWILALADKNERGLYHAVHDDYASWAEIFGYVCEVTGWNVKINPTKTAAAKLPAKRPCFSVLSNHKLRACLGMTSLGSFRDPLRRFLVTL